jgi:hypothetical protein
VWELCRGKQGFTLSVLAALLLFAPSGLGAAKADCLSCHNNAASVLKGSHPAVTTFSMDACLGCHKPADNKLPAPNPFFARMHRTHVDAKGTISCALCHVRQDNRGFGLQNEKRALSYGVLNEKEMPLIRGKFLSWAGSAYLDGVHGKANVGCAACHGTTIAGKGAKAESTRCMACHGFYECLADKTAPKDFPERNPHSSHLGQPACTLCHKGHTASRSACADCHAGFSTKIPAGIPGVR